MDQSQLQALDPKLREAYERVMGTNAAPRASSPQNPPLIRADQPVIQPLISIPPAPAAPPMPAAQPMAQAIPQQPQMQSIPAQMPPAPEVPFVPPMPQPPVPPVIPPPVAPAMPPPQPMAAPEQQSPLNQPMKSTLSSIDSTDSTQMHAYVANEVADVKKSLKLIQLVYIIGGLIFFAVYALFWMRFFNLALPL